MSSGDENPSPEQGLLLRHHKVDLIIVFEVAIKVIFPFLVGMAGWTYTNITDHNTRILRIESTHYSRSDVDAESARTRTDLARVNLELAEIRGENRANAEILKRVEERMKDISKVLETRK